MMIGTNGVYTVLAETEEEARERIEAELTPKPHRQAILRAWIEEGRKVRKQGPWRDRYKR